MKNQYRKGITLIETLIYAVLVSLTLAAVLYSVYALISNSQALNDKIVAEEEANFIIKKLEWALIGYESITSPSSGSSGASLTVNKVGFGSNPIVFDLSDGVIRIKKGTGEATPLSSNKVTVTDLNFTHIAASDDSPSGLETTFNIDDQQYKFVIYKKQ